MTADAPDLLDFLNAEPDAAGEESTVLGAIREIPAGRNFTANTIRAELDRADVPQARRGHLMRAACAQGLCEPVLMDLEGVKVHVKVPSTGESAKGAYVALYRRKFDAPKIGGA